MFTSELDFSCVHYNTPNPCYFPRNRRHYRRSVLGKGFRWAFYCSFPPTQHGLGEKKYSPSISTLTNALSSIDLESRQVLLFLYPAQLSQGQFLFARYDTLCACRFLEHLCQIHPSCVASKNHLAGYNHLLLWLMSKTTGYSNKRINFSTTRRESCLIHTWFFMFLAVDMHA